MGSLYAIGRLYDQTLVFSQATAAVFCVAALAFASCWPRRLDVGPLERILRRLAG